MRTVCFVALTVLIVCISAPDSAAKEKPKHGSVPKGGRTPMFQIISKAFAHKESIPMQYTCKGKDVSPPLSFVNIPEKAKSLALVVDDPDAPDPKAPRTIWVHWVAYNIPPDTSEVKEAGPLPAGSLEGQNDWKQKGWRGPCPPIGRHRYFFKLYALSEMLPDLKNPTKKELLSAMQGKIVAEAELMGSYQK